MKNAMNIVKGVAVAGALVMSGNAMAEFSGNVGITSNYVWRGVTQTADQSAISGGLDYAHESGAYVGTWTSNVAGGYELDTYLGFAGKAGAVGYDVGYISYAYPHDTTLDFAEIYLGVSFADLELKLSSDGDNKSTYTEVAYSFALPAEYSLGLHYGMYGFDGGVGDYNDYSLSVGKGDFSFTMSNTDVENDYYRVAVSWSQSF